MEKWPAAEEELAGRTEYRGEVWLVKTFDMKDLEEASYILGIKLHRDWKNRMIGLS